MTILNSGYSVVVDATFLRKAQRQLFRVLAELCNVEFTILYCRASESELRSRIRQRARDGRDASEAGESVLDSQLKIIEEPDAEEMRFVVLKDPEIESRPESTQLPAGHGEK